MPRGEQSERGGMVWNDHEHYQNCTNDDQLRGYCGEFVPVNLTTCMTRADGGSFTKDMIIGPITTRGGNDWTAIHYWELFDEEAVPHRDLAIRGWRVRLLEGSPDGPELGYPPLHDHHTTVELNEPMDDGSMGAKGWVEQQADSQCSGEVDGFECHVHDLRAKGAFIPTGTDWGIREFSLFNDVRPMHSPPLVWYFTVTIELEPREEETPLVQMGQYMIQHWYRYGTQDNTLDVPIGRDSFFFSQGAFLTGGTIVDDTRYTHVHTHAQRYHASYIIAASVEEMGLAKARYASRKFCSVVETASAGFGSNEEMMAYLEETLPSFFSLRHPGTKLLCVARAGSARVGAYDYDRRNSLECSGREFRRGQIYTSVGFFGGHEGQTPPPMPVTMHGTMQMPMLNFPMHMNWQIAFTLPASANLTDTPLFVNDAVAMMAVQTDGSITNATSSSDPDNAELARLSEECGAYASGGMTPPGQRAPR